MTHRVRLAFPRVFPLVTCLALAACGGGGTSSPSVPPGALNQMSAQSSNLPMIDTDLSTDTAVPESNVSVLKTLTVKKTIGSTGDKNGDQNPYGLTVAPATSGKITKGDLIVCNFNNKANVQGTGTTIVGLHPNVGAKPYRIAQNAALNGCAALALDPGDNPWAAAYSANDNPFFDSNGNLISTLKSYPWSHPWGQAYSPKGATGGSAFYVSQADGSIVRINISPSFSITFDKIATEFGWNGGQPGGILAPSGLEYSASTDTLYVIDGLSNTITSLHDVATIPAGGIVVLPGGKAFGGPFAKRAHLVASGAPMNGPISAALLPGGHIVVGNTLDPNGKNLMIEYTASGQRLFTKNVDTGTAGAIFGMVATGTSDATTKIYFNDDNANAVEVLEH